MYGDNVTQPPISIESFRAPKPNPWKPWLIATVAAVAILGIAIGLMFLFGLFDAVKDDTGDKKLVASLGLIGAVLSAVVTLIGIVVKYSIDDNRNAQLTAIDTSRNFSLANEAEKSNRIDATIRAVDLLSENNQDTTIPQMSGALLALVTLGELELAVSLLGILWPERRVSSQVAEVILRKALLADSDNIKSDAAAVLANNASQIQDPDHNIWPIPNLGWSTHLPVDARIVLIYAASEWLILDLEKDPGHLPVAALVLHDALADPTVAHVASACLRPLRAFPPGFWVGTGARMLSVGEIMESLEAHPDVPESFQAQIYKERAEAALARREEELPESDLGSTN